MTRKTTMSALSAAAMLALVAVATASTRTPEDVVSEAAPQEVPDWLHFDIDDVRAQRAGHGRPWQEFIRVPDLFTGLYEIPAGGEDGQSPHAADEVYYILSGRATALVEGDRVAVGPGSVLYVAKDKEHRFVDITEDLSILVFFATAAEAGDD